MENLSILDENWKVLLSIFPREWREDAIEQGAIERFRTFTAEELMRTFLLHLARGYSLRETVVRAKAAGITTVSDVALLKRLRRSEGWFRSLCVALLNERGVDSNQSIDGLSLRLFDGTLVKEPGKTGSNWRIHYSLMIPGLECDFFKLTPSEGKGVGETFAQYPIAVNDFIIADRNYSTANGIAYVANSGGYVLVRVHSTALPLFSRKTQRFPLLKRLTSIKEAGKAHQWKVIVRTAERDVVGRLCAIRKSESGIEAAHRRLHRRAVKRRQTLKKETLEFAKYVFVFTTFPEERFGAKQVMDWYRLRWQIELSFKRLKSLAQLGHLPKHDDESSRAWLYGKLFVALLTEKLIRLGRDISPWGYIINDQTCAKRVA